MHRRPVSTMATLTLLPRDERRRIRSLTNESRLPGRSTRDHVARPQTTHDRVAPRFSAHWFCGARDRNRTADLRTTRPSTYVRSGADLRLVVSQFSLALQGFLDEGVTPCDGSKPLGMRLVGPMLDRCWTYFGVFTGQYRDSRDDNLSLGIDRKVFAHARCFVGLGTCP
ncbi:MAG: hypothetical protein QOG97_1947 [Acidimicrobiaceae bacterium]|jgi:hypothetical protein|nr:hypothetical protein [Acidimicrobiaceae bacterium]